MPATALPDDPRQLAAGDIDSFRKRLSLIHGSIQFLASRIDEPVATRLEQIAHMVSLAEFDMQTLHSDVQQGAYPGSFRPEHTTASMLGVTTTRAAAE